MIAAAKRRDCLWCGRVLVVRRSGFIGTTYCSNRCRSDMVMARTVAHHPGEPMPPLTERQRLALLVELRAAVAAIEARITELERSVAGVRQ